MNAAKTPPAEADETANTVPPIPEQPIPTPAPTSAPQPQFNPMADIIERHESAVNRLKRGK